MALPLPLAPRKLETQPCPQDVHGPEATLRGRFRGSVPAALGSGHDERDGAAQSPKVVPLPPACCTRQSPLYLLCLCL